MYVLRKTQCIAAAPQTTSAKTCTALSEIGCENDFWSSPMKWLILVWLKKLSVWRETQVEDLVTFLVSSTLDRGKKNSHQNFLPSQPILISPCNHPKNKSPCLKLLYRCWGYAELSILTAWFTFYLFLAFFHRWRGSLHATSGGFHRGRNTRRATLTSYPPTPLFRLFVMWFGNCGP